MDKHSAGYCYLFGGPVKSGKTTAAHAQKNLLACCKTHPKKPIIVKFNVDSRFDNNTDLYNHNQIRLSTDKMKVSRMSVVEMLSYDFSNYDIVLLDELHIELLRVSKTEEAGNIQAELEDTCVEFIYDQVYNKKKTFILVMNDYWHNGDPVQLFTKLVRISSEVKIMRARCDKCGRCDATLSEYNSATKSKEDVLHPGAEDDDLWLAVCAVCWKKKDSIE